MMKFAQEAAEKIVTGGRTLTDADSTAKAMIQHTKTIIETCYNARSGEVTWEETTFGELKPGGLYKHLPTAELIYQKRANEHENVVPDRWVVYRPILPSPDVKVSPDYAAIRGKLEVIAATYDISESCEAELHKVISMLPKEGE